MQSFLQNRRIKRTARAQITAAKESISDARLRAAPTRNSSLERGASLHTPEDVYSDLSLVKYLPGVELLDDQGPYATKPRFLVTGWAYDDVENPRNFPLAKRICATLMVSALGCVVGVASSIYAGVALQNAEAYGVSEVAVSVVTGEPSFLPVIYRFKLTFLLPRHLPSRLCCRIARQRASVGSTWS